MENIIEFGDNREIMKRWAQMGVKVQTCVTSPPYFGLRDYQTGTWVGGDPTCDHIERHSIHSGERADRDQTSQIFQYTDVCGKCGAVREDKQLGLEETPEEYIANMVDVFRHVRDILSDDGTLWVNIGDSYAREGGTGKKSRHWDGREKDAGNEINGFKLLAHDIGLKPKDLIGIPWMLAFALRADGWYLRQDIIWEKRNPMPESVRDRCTKSHEYIFLLSKSQKYYFDNEAIKETATKGPQRMQASSETILQKCVGPMSRGEEGFNHQYADADRVWAADGKRNKRSVWTVNTKPYKGAHFATYPPELIEPCVLAGARFGDIVLDPFMGSGTTAEVAIKNGRKYLGCELNSTYKQLQDERITNSHKTKPALFQDDTESLFKFE